jgi:antitoxin VapB
MEGFPMQPNRRAVKLFRNGRNQAVRIPVEFELPGTDAVMFREGDRLVIEPVRKGGLAALLDSWGDIGEDFPEIEDLPLDPEEIF